MTASSWTTEFAPNSAPPQDIAMPRRLAFRLALLLPLASCAAVAPWGGYKQGL